MNFATDINPNSWSYLSYATWHAKYIRTINLLEKKRYPYYWDKYANLLPTALISYILENNPDDGWGGIWDKDFIAALNHEMIERTVLGKETGSLLCQRETPQSIYETYIRPFLPEPALLDQHQDQRCRLPEEH